MIQGLSVLGTAHPPWHAPWACRALGTAAVSEGAPQPPSCHTAGFLASVTGTGLGVQAGVRGTVGRGSGERGEFSRLPLVSASSTPTCSYPHKQPAREGATVQPESSTGEAGLPPRPPVSTTLLTKGCEDVCEFSGVHWGHGRRQGRRGEGEEEERGWSRRRGVLLEEFPLARFSGRQVLLSRAPLR